MLLPNRAYSATFSCESSSRRSPRDSSSWDTSSSMRSVEVTRRDCASESGREIKESPILYLVLFCYFNFWTFELCGFPFVFLSPPFRYYYTKWNNGGGSQDGLCWGLQEGENDRENLTAQIRPHLRARAPLRFLRDPLCLSGGQVSLQSFHRMFGEGQRIFEKQWHRREGKSGSEFSPALPSTALPTMPRADAVYWSGWSYPGLRGAPPSLLWQWRSLPLSRALACRKMWWLRSAWYYIFIYFTWTVFQLSSCPAFFNIMTSSQGIFIKQSSPPHQHIDNRGRGIHRKMFNFGLQLQDRSTKKSLRNKGKERNIELMQNRIIQNLRGL